MEIMEKHLALSLIFLLCLAGNQLNGQDSTSFKDTTVNKIIAFYRSEGFKNAFGNFDSLPENIKTLLIDSEKNRVKLITELTEMMARDPTIIKNRLRYGMDLKRGVLQRIIPWDGKSKMNPDSTYTPASPDLIEEFFEEWLKTYVPADASAEIKERLRIDFHQGLSEARKNYQQAMDSKNNLRE